MRYIVANLKMNLVTVAENNRYLSRLTAVWEQSISLSETVQTILCPSIPFLSIFQNKLPKGVSLGAQDASSEERGAHTGDISPMTLVDLGATSVILGHSERRSLGETDESIAAKIIASWRAKLSVILCIGETAEERHSGQMAEVIRRQLLIGLSSVEEIGSEQLIIAYEPRWAIGSDQTPSSDEILEVSVFIRRVLSDRFGLIGREIPILYGGSVSTSTLEETCLRPNLSGVLVGRESLDPSTLMAIRSRMEG